MEINNSLVQDISFLDTPTEIPNLPANTQWLERYKGLLGQNIGGSSSLSSKWNSGDFLSSKPTIADFAMPVATFDPDKEGLKRFQSSENFGTFGFVAGRDNEELYGQYQTVGEIMGNAFSQMWDLTKYQFKDQLAGWGRMFEFNPIGDDMEEVNAGMDEIMNSNPIFMTKADRESTFNWAKFGNIVGQSGFTLGAAGEILFEEMILTAANALTFGALTPVQSARTAQLAAKFAGVMSRRAAMSIREAYKASDVILDANKMRPLYKRLSEKAAQYTPFTNTLQFAAKGAKNGENALQLTARGFGSFYRDLREANAAFTEARVESAGTFVELRDELIEGYKEKNGDYPTGRELERIERIANEGKSANFIANSIIIGASNRIQFDNLFKGFKGVNKFMGESGKILEDKAGFFKKGFNLRTLKATAKTAPFTYFKNNITEGLQETLQSTSNVAVKSWYKDNYFNPETRNVFKSVKEGLKSQVSQEGLDTFLAGFLTGSIAGPIQSGSMWAINKASTFKLKDQRKQRDTYFDEKIKELNEYYNFNDKRNLAKQVNIANKMAEAVKEGDKKKFYDLKDESLRSFVRAGIETNKLDALFDQLEGSVQNLTEQEFKDAYGVDSDKKNILSSIDDIRKKAEDIKKVKEDLDFKFPTNYTSDRILPKAYEEAKWQLTFMQNSVQRLRTRQTNLMQEALSQPELADISNLELNILLDSELLKKEVKLIKDEIKVNNTPEKVKKLKILEAIAERDLSPELLKTYFKLVSDRKISEAALAETFDSIKDYVMMSEDEKKMSETIDSVMNPEAFYKFAEEHQDTQTELKETPIEVVDVKEEAPLDAQELTEEQKNQTTEVEGEPVRTNLIEEYARRLNKIALGTPNFGEEVKKISDELFTGENAVQNNNYFRNEAEKRFFGERNKYWRRFEETKKRLKALYDSIQEGQTELDEADALYVEEASEIPEYEIMNLIRAIQDRLKGEEILTEGAPKEEAQEQGIEISEPSEVDDYEPLIQQEEQEQEEVEIKVLDNERPPTVVEKPTVTELTFSTIRNEVSIKDLPSGLVDKDGKKIPFIQTEDYGFVISNTLRNLITDGTISEYRFRMYNDNKSFYEHEQLLPESERFKDGTYRYQGERTGLVIIMHDKSGRKVYVNKKGEISTDPAKGYLLTFFIPSAYSKPEIGPVRDVIKEELLTKPYINLQFTGYTKGIYDNSSVGEPTLDLMTRIGQTEALEAKLKLDTFPAQNGKKTVEAVIDLGNGISPIYLRKVKGKDAKYEGEQLNPLAVLDAVKDKEFAWQQAKDIAEYLQIMFSTTKVRAIETTQGRGVILVEDNINRESNFSYEFKIMGNDNFFVHTLTPEGSIKKKKVSYRKFLLENTTTNVVPIKTPNGSVRITPVNNKIEFKAKLSKPVVLEKAESQASTIEELEAERDEKIAALEEEKTLIQKELEEIQKSGIQETVPEVTEEEEPEIEDEKPTGLFFNISNKSKIKAYWSSSEGKWNFYNTKGKKITAPKQIKKYSATFTKNSARWANTWWTQLLSDRDRAEARDMLRRLQDLLEQGQQNDVDYMNMDAFIMQYIKGVKFNKKYFQKELTDVNKSVWLSDKGTKVDTFVMEDLLPELQANGFSAVDEQDVINSIIDLVNRYPNGITKKDIETELANSNPAKQLIILEEDFIDRFGFDLSEMMVFLNDNLQNLLNEPSSENQGQPETDEDVRESEEVESETEEITAATSGIVLSTDEKQVVSEVFEENREGEETQDEFLTRHVKAELDNKPLEVKGPKTLVEKFKAIIKRLLAALTIVGIFYTAANPVADFMGRKGIISREKTAFIMDITGLPSSISEKSFNDDEKGVLYNLIKTAESNGQSYVTYKDYPTGNQGVKQKATDTDSEGNNIKGSPELTIKRTLGQFSFSKVGDSYVVSDKYNFNDAGEKSFSEKIADVVDGFKDKSTSAYAKIRKVATNFGSKEGEGSDVKVVLPQTTSYKKVQVPVEEMGVGSPIILLLAAFARRRKNNEPIEDDEIQKLKDRIAEIDLEIARIKEEYAAKIDALKAQEKVVTLPQEMFEKVVEFLEKTSIIIEKICK